MNPEKCEATRSAEAPPSSLTEASQGIQWIERWIDHGTPWVQHAGSEGYPVSRSVASAETPNSCRTADEVQWIERWIDNGTPCVQPAGSDGYPVSRSVASAETPNSCRTADEVQWIERWIDNGTPCVQPAGSEGYPVSRSVASAETPNSCRTADEIQWIHRWIDNGVQWTQPAGAARAHPSSSTSAVGDCVSRSLACAEQHNLQHNDHASETSSLLCDGEDATIMGLPVDTSSITTTIASQGSLSHPFEN